MATKETIGNEAAVNELTLNPTQEKTTMATTNNATDSAALVSTLNPDASDNSVHTDCTDESAGIPSNQTATTIINPLEPEPGDSAHIIKFKTIVAAALANPDFIGDHKKVEKATIAATMPNAEDRVRAQLKTHAERNLRAKAALEAERTGIYVAPTQADFDAYIEKGVITWREKQLQ